MKPFEQYSIPLGGMKLGVHQYHFSVGKEFFQNFEDAPDLEGSFQVNVTFDKRPNMVDVEFNFRGKLEVDCDRCLQPINLPVENEYHLILKYSEDVREEVDIIYLNTETQILNIANYIYEFIILSIPMTKIYDCENDVEAPCDYEMLKYLEAEEESADDNPIWKELKNLENLRK